MHIAPLLHSAKKYLTPISDTPLLDAEILLEIVLQKPRSFLVAHPKFRLSIREQKAFGMLLQRRISGDSVALLRGKQDFFGREFFINTDVLIPRSETELLVSTLIPFVRHGGTFVDMGTGSGCIAITIAKESAAEKIIALDISEDALKVARKNAHKHDVRISFRTQNLFDGESVEHEKKPLIIAANLPYLPENERHISTQKEPDLALYAGKDGLDLFRLFFAQLTHINFDGCGFEFHPPQKEILEKWMASLFPKHHALFFTDYSKQWRFGVLKKNDH